MSSEPFAQHDLRQALSTFATGVTIVTTSDPTGEPVGMTASSFNSVSMDPPLILWSVAKSALSAQAFERTKYFNVHVLSAQQMDLSNRFSKSGAAKFEGIDYTLDENNTPILPDCTSRFDCSTWSVYEGGDHWIIVGKVMNIDVANHDPLVFSGGTYAISTPLRPQQKLSNPDDTNAIDGLLIYNLARAYRQVADQFHDVVRDAGLTVPQWRILASLHEQASRDMTGLAARTFIDPASLHDLLVILGAEGLCEVDRSDDLYQVKGTQKGHNRVENLFRLGREIEAKAIGEESGNKMETLLDLLKVIIDNTNR